MSSETPWEDYLLERKTENDLKDLLKTMVAFANLVKPDHVATILIRESTQDGRGFSQVRGRTLRL